MFALSLLETVCLWCSFVLFVAEKGGRGSGVSLLLSASSLAGSLRQPLDGVPITGAAFLCCTLMWRSDTPVPGAGKTGLFG